eukprot:gb/GEZN01027956.1/.p1 GENE.gb/GEZN01027956.1/~~gb/GEZN01027956.1/.p1  ORF type:complete len:124 (-),score=12.54 gb/GEZN01027956.1/:76-447(-)
MTTPGGSSIEVVPDGQDTEQLLKLLEDGEDDLDEYYDPDDEPENFTTWLTKSVRQAPVWTKAKASGGVAYRWSSWGFGKIKTWSFYATSLGFMFLLPIAFSINSEIAMLEAQKQARQLGNAKP